MNPQEQRIAIAEAVGYKKVREGDNRGRTGKNLYGFKSNSSYISPIPDYLNDLNAMGDALKTIDHPNFRGKFLTELEKVVKNEDRIWPLVTASAPARAEAFLWTIGKWRDS